MTALFRIVEPSNGVILIDGLDVSTLDLPTLRSRLRIIPQEPIMFTDTVRINIDVESKFPDQDIWSALELVGLKTYVSELPEKLDAFVAERGENFSVTDERVNTIADFDRIMVLDAGELVEFDTPSNLLGKDGGLFKALVDATGPANAALVAEIAQNRK
ncbi:hypothetical protein HK100_000285 [Physocladia obscura]|uniref:ABC transporter domain-containing protein n=1 Tax=Physocladia obscura TaxID=109957 RepID=A0AAD5SYN3_9FUNG|nr:hypothetical protein HK100_000285 [Physocladia obscura]